MTALFDWLNKRFNHGGILEWTGSILGLLVVVPLIASNGQVFPRPSRSTDQVLTFLGIGQTRALNSFHSWMTSPIRYAAIGWTIYILFALVGLGCIVVTVKLLKYDGPARLERLNRLLLRLLAIAWVLLAVGLEVDEINAVGALVALIGFLALDCLVVAIADGGWHSCLYGPGLVLMTAFFALIRVPARIVGWAIAVRADRSTIELDNKLYKEKKKRERLQHAAARDRNFSAEYERSRASRAEQYRGALEHPPYGPGGDSG